MTVARIFDIMVACLAWPHDKEMSATGARSSKERQVER
jgi:hypothetical protein